MTCYVCLDDKNGMLFNRRRQSRDALVLEDIRSSIRQTLTIDVFSEKLIQQAGIPYVLAPEDLAELPEDAHFFLEARSSLDAATADRIVLYRWNRHYPADTYWELDLAQHGFSLLETTEFPGKSHEMITKEVYAK